MATNAEPRGVAQVNGDEFDERKGLAAYLTLPHGVTHVLSPVDGGSGDMRGKMTVGQ